MNDTRNTMLAIALSFAVLLGWQFFFGFPEGQKAPKQAASQGTTQNAQGNAAGLQPQAKTEQGVPATLSDAAKQAAAPRISIDTPRLQGSLSLLGGRFDTLSLKNYHETVDPKSKTIGLFAPLGSSHPYYAEFGWVGADAALDTPKGQTLWQIESGQKLTPNSPVTLKYETADLVFKRTLEVDEKYLFKITETITNKGSKAQKLHPYGLITRIGHPKTEGFYISHEGLVGVLGEAGLQEFTFDNMDKEGLKQWKNKEGFMGFGEKYWASAIVPPADATYDARFASVKGAGTNTYQTDYLLQAYDLAPGETKSVMHKLFAGAKEVNVIEGYQSKEGVKQFDLLIDWGWFYFFTKPLFHVLSFFNSLLGNFGVAILIVTVLVKLLFFPLANKSYISMSKMKQVQPEMTQLRERFKDDKVKLQQEMMDLYKREKINPAAGCLPILLQIPVFFALYKVLFVTIEMRHAPFFGWIQDLAAPDPTSIFNLFGLIPWAPPAFLLIGIWPIIMGITMFVQMQMNPPPADPTQKMLFSWMPLFFTFLLATFPAGLVIYWSWNNLLSIIQQYVIMKRMNVKVELFDNLKGFFKLKSAA